MTAREPELPTVSPSAKPPVPGALKRLLPGIGPGVIFVLLDQGLDLREIVVRAQVSPVQVRELYEEWFLSLEDGRQLRSSQLHLAQAPPPPAARVAVAVAAAPEEPAAPPATVALVDETAATDTISDTNDPMEHLLAAAERLLGQQTKS